MRINCFKPTLDDWYGNYKIANDTRHINKSYVEVSLLSFPDNSGFRVCVWGNDDMGMERDYIDLTSAQEMFEMVCLAEYVSKDQLKQFNFVPA